MRHQTECLKSDLFKAPVFGLNLIRWHLLFLLRQSKRKMVWMYKHTDSAAGLNKVTTKMYFGRWINWLKQDFPVKTPIRGSTWVLTSYGKYCYLWFFIFFFSLRSKKCMNFEENARRGAQGFNQGLFSAVSASILTRTTIYPPNMLCSV